MHNIKILFKESGHGHEITYIVSESLMRHGPFVQGLQHRSMLAVSDHNIDLAKALLTLQQFLSVPPDERQIICTYSKTLAQLTTHICTTL